MYPYSSLVIRIDTTDIICLVIIVLLNSKFKCYSVTLTTLAKTKIKHISVVDWFHNVLKIFLEKVVVLGIHRSPG